MGQSQFPPTVVRVYRGAQQADAIRAFQRDAATLAQSGYQPTSQSWAPGQWGCGAFLVALLLCFVLIGILIFIYMLIVHPSGTLTVTYAWQAPPQVPIQRTPAWVPTHRVPSGGMDAWNVPDGSGPPASRLPESLDLAVVSSVGDWAQVSAVNGWRGWVDGRRLTKAPAPPPASPS
jgi:hypothetical protein